MIDILCYHINSRQLFFKLIHRTNRNINKMQIIYSVMTKEWALCAVEFYLLRQLNRAIMLHRQHRQRRQLFHFVSVVLKMAHVLPGLCFELVAILCPTRNELVPSDCY